MNMPTVDEYRAAMRAMSARGWRGITSKERAIIDAWEGRGA